MTNRPQPSVEVVRQAMTSIGELVVSMSGGEALHAHEHLIKHLLLTGMFGHERIAVQGFIAFPTLELLAGRVGADGVKGGDQDPASRDCARANAFVEHVKRVITGVTGVEIS